MANKDKRNDSMPQNAPIVYRGGVVKNAATYEEFIRWFALPRHEKIKEGIESQEQFCAFHHVDRKTLFRWTKRLDFAPRAEEQIRSWIKERKPDIVAAIYHSAIKGNPLSQMLWLKAFEGFTERQEVVHTRKVELGANDLRFIIDNMPEPYRSKFYGYLREIIDTGVTLRDARELQDVARGEQYNAAGGDVSGEADPDAQDVPNKKHADEMAESYQSCLRGNLVGQVLSYHHQSTARWWEI